MNIEVIKSKIHQLGVFALIDFKLVDIIETCPIIVLPKKDRELIDKTTLYNYYFDWRGEVSISLGYGSLYNQSYKPNARYIKDYQNNCINFVAIKKIKKGQEITVNYNGSPRSKKKLWFIPNTESTDKA